MMLLISTFLLQSAARPSRPHEPQQREGEVTCCQEEEQLGHIVSLLQTSNRDKMTKICVIVATHDPIVLVITARTRTQLSAIQTPNPIFMTSEDS